MLNSNRVHGYLAMRQPGLAGLPGVGPLLSGWRVPMQALFRPARGELYSWRRRLAQAADELGSEVLDVFGTGWRGEQISWFAAYPKRAYRCAASGSCDPGDRRRAAKHDLFSNYRFGIATENFQGTLGYISEKLFDVLMAGAVPVYLGDVRIIDFVRLHASWTCGTSAATANSCNTCETGSESEWQTMRDAGQAFLQSERMWPFTDESFAAAHDVALEAILTAGRLEANVMYD